MFNSRLKLEKVKFKPCVCVKGCVVMFLILLNIVNFMEFLIFLLFFQTVSKNNQVLQLLNSKMRVILCDNRTFIGKFVAYDKHMNLVLTDCVEYRKYKPARTKTVIEAKKNYGVVILRGENVMSVIVESSSVSLFILIGFYNHFQNVKMYIYLFFF